MKKSDVTRTKKVANGHCGYFKKTSNLFLDTLLFMLYKIWNWIFKKQKSEFISLLLIFLIVWVIFPLIFMTFIAVQRFVIFFNRQDPRSPEFDKPQKYDIKGVVNFYLTTIDLDNVTELSIGAWLLLPERDINSVPINSHDNLTAETILRNNTDYPVVIYLHGIGCNRIKPEMTYEIIRKHFLIISLDHRGYGDSAAGVPPSELGIISDTAQIFKWVRSKTNNEIYVWGHSLGSALSTHTLKRLKEEDGLVPSGLILESTYTSLKEAGTLSPFGTMFAWMPWFEATVLRPIAKNGFIFTTETNILSVDCPIMVLHAEDDGIIPYTLGRKVAEVAATKRTIPPQGNVTYHQFERRLGYGHNGITSDPNIPEYIREFIGFCKDHHRNQR